MPWNGGLNIPKTIKNSRKRSKVKSKGKSGRESKFEIGDFIVAINKIRNRKDIYPSIMKKGLAGKVNSGILGNVRQFMDSGEKAEDCHIEIII